MDVNIHNPGRTIKMGIKHYNAYTPSRRNMTSLTNEEITKKTPEKSLLAKKAKNAGRNSYGRITVRHQGGGNRQKYRIIDFKRNKEDIEATVVGIEYDPNRSANIALLVYADGEKRYILAPKGLTVGTVLVSGPTADVKPGNAMALGQMPVGSVIHNIELHPGKGGQLARSAGVSAQILGRVDNYVMVRLGSGEVRKILATCKATFGEVGNESHELIRIGKAGKARHMGKRPEVRGSVMNPNDHPHGGGEGKCPIGRPSPVTPWGKPALGLKTRKTKKASTKLIVRRRNGK